VDVIYEIAQGLEAKILQKIESEHLQTRAEVQNLASEVRQRNALLDAMRAHPHDTVKVLSKLSATVGATSIAISLTAGIHLLAPWFAILVIAGAGVFWAVAALDEKDGAKATAKSGGTSWSKPYSAP
jgi:hypothetical protein